MKNFAALFTLLVASFPAKALTPQMNLNLPVVGVTQGPQWASLINGAFTLIDSHNHTTGNGSRVPVAGLNINADFGLNGFNIAGVASVRYVNQSAPLAGASDVRSLYVVNGNLYYNNAAGASIQLTSGASINIAALGTIGGDYGGSNPAAVNFSESTSTYSFLESAGIVGRMAFGPFTVFNESLGSSGVTITAAPSFSSYTMALPATAAVDNTVWHGASSGQTYFGQVQTADIAGNAVTAAKVADGAVSTTAKIVDNIVTTPKIVDGAITQEKLSSRSSGATVGSGGLALSAGSGVFTTTGSFTQVTNLSVTLTTTGRPVDVRLVPDGTNSGNLGSYIEAQGVSAGAQIRILRSGTQIAFANLDTGAGATPTVSRIPPTALSVIDEVAAGTYTYTVELGLVSGAQVGVSRCKLVAYEL